MAGGGVGEAMLIGAAVGAGTGGVMAAAKDQDPLQGALLGAAMGAAGGGIGSGIGGLASGAATGAGTGAATGTAGGVAGGVEGGVAGGTAGVGTGAASVAGTEATSQLGQQALQNAAATQGFTVPQGYQLGAGTLGNQVAASQGFEPLATGSGFTEDVITKAAAPQSWGQQGLGQGFAPHLTNAQAYGAGIGGAGMGAIGQSSQDQNNMAPEAEPYTGSLSYFKYNPQTFRPSVAPGYADGGIASLGRQTGMYPQSQMDRTQFAVPSQMPTSREVIDADYDATINPYTGDMPRFAGGGISSLGSYSDGGRMLRGPGDGMSDDIPGVIGGKQPARLADGEFVIPADVVSHLGNGSTDAGAKKLYSMMDNVRKARTGNKKQGRQIKADRYMPGMASGGVARFDEGGSTDYATKQDIQDMLDAWKSQNTFGSSSGLQGSVYDPNYYNPQYYQDQFAQEQNRINKQQEAAQNDLNAWKNRLNVTGYEGAGTSLYDLANLSDTAKQNADINAYYQQYLGRNIGQGEAFSSSAQDIMNSPEARRWAELQSALNPDQSNLNTIQQNINRLQSSSIKYDPYTVSSRPSSSEPQFYGNIYRGEAPDFSTPGYTLTGGNLGQWSNVAGEAARASQPASMNQQVTQAYLQNLGRAPDTSGFNYWMQSGAPAADITADIAKSTEAQNIKQPEQPKAEEKKRRGGIASLTRR